MKIIEIGLANSTENSLTILGGMSHPTVLLDFLAFLIAVYMSSSDKTGQSVERCFNKFLNVQRHFEHINWREF